MVSLSRRSQSRQKGGQLVGQLSVSDRSAIVTLTQLWPLTSDHGGECDWSKTSHVACLQYKKLSFQLTETARRFVRHKGCPVVSLQMNTLPVCSIFPSWSFWPLVTLNDREHTLKIAIVLYNFLQLLIQLLANVKIALKAQRSLNGIKWYQLHWDTAYNS